MHGKPLTTRQASFEIQVRGVDIVEGLMARIEQIRGKMALVGSTMKQLERLSVTVPIINDQGARFALQFYIGNLK